MHMKHPVDIGKVNEKFKKWIETGNYCSVVICMVLRWKVMHEKAEVLRACFKDIFPFAVVLMARTPPLAETPLSLKAEAAVFPCEHHLPPTDLWHCSQDPQQSLMPDLLLPLLIWHTPQSHCVTQWHKILKPCDQATVLLVFTEERSNLSNVLSSSSPSTRQIF